MANNNIPAKPHLNLQDLFSRSKRVESDCIEWQMSRSQCGYGRVWLQGKLHTVTRLVLALTQGEPLDGQKAMHLCDNPPCINPDHLRWASHKENMDDAYAKNRMNRNKGEAHHRVKLTEAQVQEIKKLKGQLTYVQVAELFGVSRSAVGHIYSGKNWSHV